MNPQTSAPPPPVSHHLAFTDIPKEVHEAAETLYHYFEKRGMHLWEFAHVADRRLVVALQRQCAVLKTIFCSGLQWSAERPAVEGRWLAERIDGSECILHVVPDPVKEQRGGLWVRGSENRYWPVTSDRFNGWRWYGPLQGTQAPDSASPMSAETFSDTPRTDAASVTGNIKNQSDTDTNWPWDAINRGYDFARQLEREIAALLRGNSLLDRYRNAMAALEKHKANHFYHGTPVTVDCARYKGPGTAVISFSTRDLDAALEQLAAMPKPCIGIVCQPRYVRLLDVIQRDAMSDVSPERRLFCGVPIFGKDQDQPEPWRAFYDQKELRDYLDSPNTQGEAQPPAKKL